MARLHPRMPTRRRRRCVGQASIECFAEAKKIDVIASPLLETAWATLKSDAQPVRRFLFLLGVPCMKQLQPAVVWSSSEQ